MFEENNEAILAKNYIKYHSDIHRVTETPATTDLIRHLRWQWIGNVLRKESTDDARISCGPIVIGESFCGVPAIQVFFLSSVCMCVCV